jgi:hypothetical protein
MLDDNKIEKAVLQQIACRVLSELDKDERDVIITNALTRILDDFDPRWEVAQLFRAEAQKYAAEYIKQPAVVDRLKTAAKVAVEDLMQDVIKHLRKELEDMLKSSYARMDKK